MRPVRPRHAVALAALLCLAGTAFAWYLLLSRRLASGRLVAVLGGALAGFAPGLVAHAQPPAHALVGGLTRDSRALPRGFNEHIEKVIKKRPPRKGRPRKAGR